MHFRDLSPHRREAAWRAAMRLHFEPVRGVLAFLAPPSIPNATTHVLSGAIALALEGWR